MAKMTLLASDVNSGVAYTFPNDPFGVARIEKPKTVSAISTLESEGVFDWGFKSVQAGLQGVKRTLTWPYMRSTFYDKLRGYYETAQDVTWNPQAKAHASLATYKVKVLDLRAANVDTVLDSVRNVEMDLEIVTVA